MSAPVSFQPPPQGAPGHLPLNAPPSAVAAQRGPITGDAVELDPVPAPLGYRILSGAIDLVCIFVITLLLVLLVMRLAVGWDSALVATASVVLSVTANVAWPAAFETFTRGRSPGKFALGLRVTRVDGGPIQFRHAFARALIGVVELQMFSGIPALVSAAASWRHQRMGDRIAGTVVVHERTRWQPPTPPQMPPYLASWAGSADLDLVPEQQLHWCQQILTRPNMTPTNRTRALAGMVTQIAPWILPPPPPASDQDIVSAVLAERHRRAAMRESRDADLRMRVLGDDW